MKKGSKIGLIVGAIILIIAIVGGYFFINDATQKAKIVEEFEEIQKITKSSDFNMDQLNEKTGNIVTSGKYAKVEKAAKTYASDVFSTAFEIRTIIGDEKISKILTADNYESDGPEFTETKQYLSDTKNKIEELKTKMLDIIKEEKINSYIESETQDSYSIELYKELLKKDIEISDTEKNTLEQSIDKVINMLSIEEEVINFLIENKGKWKVQGGQIVFNANDLVVKYNGYITKLRIL